MDRIGLGEGIAEHRRRSGSGGWPKDETCNEGESSNGAGTLCDGGACCGWSGCGVATGFRSGSGKG